jgi:WD40 repeat protein
MRLRLLIAIGWLFVGFGVAVRAQEKNAVDPQVRKQIEELNLTYDGAFNHKDAEAVASLFTADAVECQVVGEPMKHEDAVESAQFSADGQKIVTASADNTARLWDVSTR